MYRSQIEGNSLRLCFKWSVAVSFGDTYDNFLGCHSKLRLAACCQMGLKSGIETQIQRHVCSVTRVEENCSTVDVDAQCGRTGFAFQPLQQNVNSRRRVDAVSPARARHSSARSLARPSSNAGRAKLCSRGSFSR